MPWRDATPAVAPACCEALPQSPVLHVTVQAESVGEYCPECRSLEFQVVEIDAPCSQCGGGGFVPLERPGRGSKVERRMRFRNLRIAWSVCWGLAAVPPDRVVVRSFWRLDVWVGKTIRTQKSSGPIPASLLSANHTFAACFPATMLGCIR